MAALTESRNTPEKAGLYFHDPVAATTTLHAGGLACLNAAGNLVPGSVSTTLKARGRAEETVVNAGAAGAVNCQVKAGVFRFGNSAAGDAIARADIGADCYVVDDQTVAKTSGTNTRSIAGTVMDVDSVGVWVRIGL